MRIEQVDWNLVFPRKGESYFYMSTTLTYRYAIQDSWEQAGVNHVIARTRGYMEDQ